MTQQPPPFPGQDRTGAAGYQPQNFVCPKCQGAMRTYDRNGVHVEQCETCRGLFLDFGEFERLSQLESRFVAQPPPTQYGDPYWGQQGGHRYRKRGLSGLFFSS
ncbi:zf-TFIIB domain-containing protein [Intrasporangium sp.]|uniref:TFIIB-type zinc ribbon-containing protein n=1 Tax=Intrasporangium sp. TaxID=1925024 RepID=UPI003222100C